MSAARIKVWPMGPGYRVQVLDVYPSAVENLRTQQIDLRITLTADEAMVLRDVLDEALSAAEDSRPCPDCDQPMLPPGRKKRPNEYDHASGCPRAAPAPGPDTKERA